MCITRGAILPPPGEDVSYLENLAQELHNHEVDVRTLVVGNAAAQTIVGTAASERADLIMLATHGRSGMDRLMLGSAAERVVRNMPCPIFLLPIRDPAQSVEQTTTEAIAKSD